MKSNYIRIFLLALIVVIFMSLSTKWQEMYGEKPVKTKTPVTKTDTQGTPLSHNDQESVSTKEESSINLDTTNIKPIVINTKVFKNLSISPLNGTIIGAALKNYNISLNNKAPMPLLSDAKGQKYFAQSLLSINGKIQTINFSHQSTQKNGDITVVTMVANINGIEINRTYKLDDSNYAIDVKQTIKNTSGKSVSVSFDNKLIRQLEAKKSSFSLLDAHTYSFKGAGLSSTHKPFQKESFSDLDKSTDPVEVTTDNGWAAMVQHYFVSLWLPNNNDQSVKVYANKIAQNTYQSGVKTLPVILNSDNTITNDNILYTGPTITKNLNAMTDGFTKAKPLGLDKLVDYGLLSFISVIIFWLMSLIHSVVFNWGVAIILVTVLIKLIFYPLSAKSYKSMAKMRLLQPRMKKLQALYKDDRQKLGKKMMEMYKEEKVNPASGCLPILVQIPVFIALYWVLLESVQLRQSPFIFWIHDLASKDPYFVLPILMGISMFIQQKLSPTSADPTQAKIMMFMPIVFTFFFSSFPAGLVLYWLTNNIISILQQWYITKKYTSIYKAKRS